MTIYAQQRTSISPMGFNGKYVSDIVGVMAQTVLAGLEKVTYTALGSLFFVGVYFKILDAKWSENRFKLSDEASTVYFHNFSLIFQKAVAPQNGESIQLAAQNGEAIQSAAQDGESIQPAPQDGESIQLAAQDGEAIQLAAQDGEAIQPAPQDGESIQLAPQDGAAIQLAPQAVFEPEDENMGGILNWIDRKLGQWINGDE